MSDALGQDQFQPVNRRAGYGDALEMALSAARKGWTLSAGQGALIVEHYEEKLAAVREAASLVCETAVEVQGMSYCEVYTTHVDALCAAAALTQEDV